MSVEDGGGRQDHTLSWENQTWALLNSCSDGEEKSSKQLLRSSSNSPTLGTHPQPPIPMPLVGKKRGRDVGMMTKNNDTDNDNQRDENGKSSGVDVVVVGESDHEMHIWTERERRKKMRNMFANLHALLPQLPAKADKSTIVDEAVNYIKTLQQTVQKLQTQKDERFQNNLSASASASVLTSTFGYDHQLKLPCEASNREAFLADQGSSNDLSAVLLSNGSNGATANAISVRYDSSALMFQTWTSSNVVLSICGGEAQIGVCSVKKAGLFSTICYVLEKHKIEVVSAHVSSDFNRSMFMIQARINRGSDQFTEALLVEDIFKQAAGEIIFWLSS